VIAEFDLKGTHKGPLRGIPATGKEFTCRSAAFFLFEDDRFVCERVYFDAATFLSQLGPVQPPPSLQDMSAAE